MSGNGLTRVGAVVGRLVELHKEHSDLQVLDGPHLGEVMDEAFVVGLTDGPDRPGYEATATVLPGMGKPRYREDVTVRCLLTLTSGTTNLAALRERAVDLLTALAVALGDDHVAAGAWDRAEFAREFEWIPIQHEQGATVNVLYSIVCSSAL